MHVETENLDGSPRLSALFWDRVFYHWINYKVLEAPAFTSWLPVRMLRFCACTTEFYGFWDPPSDCESRIASTFTHWVIPNLDIYFNDTFWSLLLIYLNLKPCLENQLSISRHSYGKISGMWQQFVCTEGRVLRRQTHFSCYRREWKEPRRWKLLLLRNNTEMSVFYLLPMVCFSYFLSWSVFDEIKDLEAGVWLKTLFLKTCPWGKLLIFLCQTASSVKRGGDSNSVLYHRVVKMLNAFVKYLEGCLADRKPAIDISYYWLPGRDSCFNVCPKCAQISAELVVWCTRQCQVNSFCVMGAY